MHNCVTSRTYMTNFRPQVQQKLAKFVLLQTLTQKLVPTSSPSCFQWKQWKSDSSEQKNKKVTIYFNGDFDSHCDLWLSYSCNYVLELQCHSSQCNTISQFISCKFYFSFISYNCNFICHIYECISQLYIQFYIYIYEEFRCKSL